jgi:hypothetical protein
MTYELYPSGTPYTEVDPETWPGVTACQCTPGDCPGAEPDYPESQPVGFITVNGIDLPVYERDKYR